MNGKLTYPVLIDCVKSLYLLKAYIIRCSSILYIYHCFFKCLTVASFVIRVGRIYTVALCCLSVQAEVKGQKVTWLAPHPLQQVVTDDDDFNIMLNFLEFYEVSFFHSSILVFSSISICASRKCYLISIKQLLLLSFQ